MADNIAAPACRLPATQIGGSNGRSRTVAVRRNVGKITPIRSSRAAPRRTIGAPGTRRRPRTRPAAAPTDRTFHKRRPRTVVKAVSKTNGISPKCEPASRAATGSSLINTCSRTRRSTFLELVVLFQDRLALDHRKVTERGPRAMSSHERAVEQRRRSDDAPASPANLAPQQRRQRVEILLISGRGPGPRRPLGPSFHPQTARSSGLDPLPNEETGRAAPKTRCSPRRRPARCWAVNEARYAEGR